MVHEDPRSALAARRGLDATAEVRYGKSTNNGPRICTTPQIMILTTKSGVRIDVESFVNRE